MIHNQHGAVKIAKKWDKTGLILEDMESNKCWIKVDRSGQVTDRNRQFLRQFTPVTTQQPGPRPDTGFIPNPVVEPEQPVVEPDHQPVVHQPQSQQIIPDTPIPNTPPRQVTSHPDLPGTPESPSFVTPPTTPIAPEPPRRSTRTSKPPERWGYDKF